jgi:ADP-heptose:LPS heptosyltransferase
MDKVLLIFSKRLGDTIFYTPALKKLHEHHPGLIIDAVALSNISVQAMAHNPALNNVFLASEKPLAELYDHYNRVLSMHDGSDIREYIGSYDVAVAERRPKGGWANYASKFLAEHFHYSAEPAGAYLLYPQAADEKKAKQLLASHGIQPSEPLMGLHMGNFRMMRYGEHFWKKIFRWRLSGRDSKSWPFDRCVQVVERLHQKYPKLKFVLTGAPSEQFLAQHFKDKDYVVSLIGQTSVLELAALMKHFNVFLTGDTGPLHIACAMNTPLVALFGKTSPNDTGPHPRAPHRKVIFEPAMDKIAVDEVYNAVDALLS